MVVEKSSSAFSTSGRQVGPRNLVRQPSWYKDMLDQGLTAQDIASLLGENGGEEALKSFGEEEGSSRDSALGQRRMMAISEATLRLQERGYHTPESRSKSINPNVNTQSESLENILLPAIPKRKTSRPLPNPRTGPPNLFSLDPQPFIEQKQSRCIPDLQYGQMLSVQKKGPKIAPGNIAVRCLGCRELLAAASLSTLVLCPACLTVSPAASTWK